MEIFKGSPSDFARVVKAILLTCRSAWMPGLGLAILPQDYIDGEAEYLFWDNTLRVEVNPSPLLEGANPVQVRLYVPGEESFFEVVAYKRPDGGTQLTMPVVGLPCPGDLPEESKERIRAAWERRRAERREDEGKEPEMEPPTFAKINMAARWWELLQAELERQGWFERPIISGENSGVEENKPSEPLQTEPTPIWELIPDKGWDRDAVKLWCKGYSAKDIADRVGANQRTVHNRISALRKDYPEILLNQQRGKKRKPKNQ